MSRTQMTTAMSHALWSKDIAMVWSGVLGRPGMVVVLEVVGSSLLSQPSQESGTSFNCAVLMR